MLPHDPRAGSSAPRPTYSYRYYPVTTPPSSHLVYNTPVLPVLPHHPPSAAPHAPHAPHIPYRYAYPASTTTTTAPDYYTYPPDALPPPPPLPPGYDTTPSAPPSLPQPPPPPPPPPSHSSVPAPTPHSHRPSLSPLRHDPLVSRLVPVNGGYQYRPVTYSTDPPRRPRHPPSPSTQLHHHHLPAHTHHYHHHLHHHHLVQQSSASLSVPPSMSSAYHHHISLTPDIPPPGPTAPQPSHNQEAFTVQTRLPSKNEHRVVIEDAPNSQISARTEDGVRNRFIRPESPSDEIPAKISPSSPHPSPRLHSPSPIPDDGMKRSRSPTRSLPPPSSVRRTSSSKSPVSIDRCSTPPAKPSAPPIPDPSVPYPILQKKYFGIPQSAIGDLLQLWDFVSSFCKTLCLTPFRLPHFAAALTHPGRSALLDALIARLVHTTLSDRQLADELSVPPSVIRALSGPSSDTPTVLSALPDILTTDNGNNADEDSESSDSSDSRDLHRAVRTLRRASKSSYGRLDAVARLRVLRELVDYACMADEVRECIVDSIGFADEERKRVREEHSAARKKADTLLRELRAELLEFRTKHGLLGEGDGEGEQNGGQCKDEPNGNGQDRLVEEVVLDEDMKHKAEEDVVKEEKQDGKPLSSRQEKVLLAQKERKERDERRAKERTAEMMEARIEKARAHLKQIKESTVRTRRVGRESADGITPGVSANADGESANGVGGMGLTVGEGVNGISAGVEDPVRTYPLGLDRLERCYWFYEGGGRLWVEDTIAGEWGSFDEMDAVRELLEWLSEGRTHEVKLKRAILARKDMLEKEICEEARVLKTASEEMGRLKKDGDEDSGRVTRYGKRKARSRSDANERNAKGKKGARPVLSFLSYRNSER